MNYYYGTGGAPASPYEQKVPSYYPGQPPSPASAYPSSFSAFGSQAAGLQNGYTTRLGAGGPSVQMPGMPSSSRITPPSAAGYPPATAYASMYPQSTIYAPAGLSPYASVQSVGTPAGLYQSVPQGSGPGNPYNPLQGSPLSAAAQSQYLASQPSTTASNLALAGMRPEYGYASMAGYPSASSMTRHPYTGAMPAYASSGAPMAPNMGSMARGQMASYSLVPGGAPNAPGAGYTLGTSPYSPRPIL